jgi:hypothetical protein
MSNPEIQIHAFDFLADDTLAHRSRLPQKISGMMKKHECDRKRDENPIHPSDPFHCGVFTSCRSPNVDRPDSKCLTRARVSGPAGVTEICGIHGGTWIVRRKNIVNAMARSAIRDGLRSGTGRKPMKAVCESWHAVGWQVVASFYPFVAVAPPAGNDRNARGIYRREWITRR